MEDNSGKEGRRRFDDSSVKQALKRCAVGFETGEVVEEFVMDNGELKLVKKKVTRRDIPPDIKAVKMLLDGESITTLSDEELEREKERILAILKEDNFG